jgi:protein transport protein SEC24
MGALKPRGPVNQGSTAGGGGGGGGGFNNESDKDAAKYLAPGDKCYMKLAVEAAEYQVAIDLFLLTNGYVDVASLGVLPRVTGGSLYRYPNFNTTLDFAQLHNDLRWNVLRCVLHSGSHTTPSAW